MNYYFAPMEGITGYIQRSAFHSFFPGIRKYFTAFLAANANGRLGSREKNDILPEHNEGLCLVPQLLTSRAEDFTRTVKTLMDYGYREVNLNLGCPSKTVVGKFRGAGFLAKPEELDRFLDAIFEKTAVKISVKTRLGMERPEEFGPLLEIYNRYPLEELIIHPRTQADFYQNKPNLGWFREACRISRHSVCYNGDLFTAEDFRVWRERFPDVDTVMIGRGLLRNPGLIGLLKEGKVADKDTFRAYHDQIYAGYREAMCGEKVVLFKMKELWSYFSQCFTNPGKYAKQIRKAQRLSAYEKAVEDLFLEQEIINY